MKLRYNPPWRYAIGKGEVESSILSNSTIRRAGYPLIILAISSAIRTLIRVAGRVDIAGTCTALRRIVVPNARHGSWDVPPGGAA